MRRAILRISPRLLAAALDVDEATDFIGASVCLTDGAIELVVSSPLLPRLAEGMDYPWTDLAALQGSGSSRPVEVQRRQYLYEGDINGQHSQG